MAFSLTSIDPAVFPEDGGHEIQISGAFEDGHRYNVYIGELGSPLDLACYSGKPSQGNVIYPWTSGILRVYSPVLTPDRIVSVTVVDWDALEGHILSNVGTTVFRSYKSLTYALRKVLPIFYKTGARSVELANRPVTEIAAPAVSIVVDDSNKWMNILYTDDGETFFGAFRAVATGSYDNYTDLAVAVEAAITSVGAFPWTVTVEGDDHIKIARGGSEHGFSVLWKTGPHGSDNADTHIGTLLGFDDSANDSDWIPLFEIISDQVPPFE